MIFFSYLKAIVWSKSMLWLAICIACVCMIYTQGLLSKVYPTLPDLWFILAWIVLLIAFWYCMTSYEAMANKVKELNKVLPIKRWLMVKCPALARISMETLVKADDMSIFWLEQKQKDSSLVRIWENYTQRRKDLSDFVYWATEHRAARETEKPTSFIVRIASGKKVYLGFDNSKHWTDCGQWRIYANPCDLERKYFVTTFTDESQSMKIGGEMGPYVGEIPDDLWKALFIASNFGSIYHYNYIQNWIALAKFTAETKNGRIGSSPIMCELRRTIVECQITNDFSAEDFEFALSKIDLGKQKQKKTTNLGG